MAGISEASRNAIADLRYSSVHIDYVSADMATDAHWIYYPDPALAYHRVLVRHNFCPGSKGVWTETNAARAQPLVPGDSRYESRHAYPLNTIGKNEAMQTLLGELRAKSVLGLGRWGEWQHYNSDVVVSRALSLADGFRG
jgi:UDP-galactopyranose mutase